MEWDINARKGDSCKASLELDIPFIFALLLRPLETGFHDVTKHLFHFLDSESFRQLIKWSALVRDAMRKIKANLCEVDLLNLQIVEDI
jgi:hypothetical protein